MLDAAVVLDQARTPVGPMTDGTPVLDFKPFTAQLLPRGTLIQPDWSHES